MEVGSNFSEVTVRLLGTVLDDFTISAWWGAASEKRTWRI